jgi:hypothetical protein
MSVDQRRLEIYPATGTHENFTQLITAILNTILSLFLSFSSPYLLTLSLLFIFSSALICVAELKKIQNDRDSFGWFSAQQQTMTMTKTNNRK